MDTTRGVAGRLDYRLVDLLEGVTHIPQGPDAHILTPAALLARRIGSNVRLSGYQAFVAAHWAELGVNQIQIPTGPNGRNPDVDAKIRWANDVRVAQHASNIHYKRA